MGTTRTPRNRAAAAAPEPEANEDGSYTTHVNDDGEKTPLPGKNPTRPDRTPRPSTRTGRAALSRREPEDHKTSEAALAAQRRESLEETGKLSFEFEDVLFVFDPDELNIGFQLKCERGAPASACLQLFGEETMEQIQTWPVDDLQTLIQMAAKTAGMGGS